MRVYHQGNVAMTDIKTSTRLVGMVMPVDRDSRGYDVTASGTRRSSRRNGLEMLRLCSMLEATTLIVLLFVAVPLKHLGHFPVAVTIMGPLHGLAFLAYVWAVFDTTSNMRWKAHEIARLVLAAFVPFAGFSTGRYLDKVRPVSAGGNDG
jgi:integral membrane protein